MKIEMLDRAREDLIEGFHFYERQEPGLGSYFLTNLYADIESLRIYGGIHEKSYRNYHRLLSQRFPFAVYYSRQENRISVHAVIDCRRNPTWIRERLRTGEDD